ncbi:MAG: hypothetical protein JW997_02010 [Actinobacteria bacterium]|nr:hypothetical protein [Actinomycetota bacterium]
MKNNSSVIEESIKDILLSEEYWIMLGKIGFSRDFILNEKLRRQKECIEYLISNYQHDVIEGSEN